MSFTPSSSSSRFLLRRRHGHAALATIFVAILCLASSSSSSSSSFATFASSSHDEDDEESFGRAPSSTTTEAGRRRGPTSSREIHILQRAAMEAALRRLGDDCSSSPTDDECGAKDDDDGRGQCNDGGRPTTTPRLRSHSSFESIREKRAYYYFHSGLAVHARRAWRMAAGQHQHAADGSKEEEEEEREYLVTGLVAKLDSIRTQLKKREELLSMEEESSSSNNGRHATEDGGGNRVNDTALHYYNEVIEDENATSIITTIHSSSGSSDDDANDDDNNNNSIRKIYQSQLDNCRNYQLHLHKYDDDTFIHMMMINDTVADDIDDNNNINKNVVDIYSVNSPSEIIERRYYDTVLSQAQEEEENNDSDYDESSNRSNPNLYVRYFDSSSSIFTQQQSSSSTSIGDHHRQHGNKDYYYYGLVAKRDYSMGEIVYTNIHHCRHHYHRKRRTNVLYFQDGNEWNRFVTSFIDTTTTTTTTTNNDNSGDYDSNENMEKDDIDNTNDTSTTTTTTTAPPLSQHSLACLVVESSSIKRISKPGRYVIIVDIDMGLFARRTSGEGDGEEGNVALADKLDRFDWLALRDIKAGEEIVVSFDNDGIEKKVEYDYTYYDDDDDDDDEKEEEVVVVEEEMECISAPNICGCDKIKQSDYRGNISITENGRTCQKWDEQSPNVHYWISIDYPNADLHDNNYCRSPDGEWPWCITTDTNVLWEYCDIPSCPTTMTIVTNQSNSSSIMTEANIHNTPDKVGDNNRKDDDVEEEEEEGGDEINVQL